MAANHMPRKGIFKEPAEAWAMAEEYRGLLFKVLNQFTREYKLPWYTRDALRDELESWAWEGLFQAATHYDTERGSAKFTTYAYRSIHNRLLRGLSDLMRMGGNFKGTKPAIHGEYKLPFVGSIDAIDQANGLEEDDRIGEQVPQPWQTEQEFESALVDRLAAEAEYARVRAIVDQMPEPHRTVVILVHFTEVEGERQNENLMIGSGHSMREVGKIMGFNATKASELLAEAHEYIKGHLEAERPDAEVF